MNGERLEPVPLLDRLNDLAGRHGVGVVDLVEDRVVGMKSRGIYETPGGTLLHTAHSELEQLVLDRRTLALKDQLAARYADLVYEGRWWSVEREALDAAVAVTQAAVTGTVDLRLYAGSAAVIGRTAPTSLYSEGLVTFEEDDVYDQADAGGFIRLFGLPTKVAAQVGGPVAGRSSEAGQGSEAGQEAVGKAAVGETSSVNGKPAATLARTGRAPAPSARPSSNGRNTRTRAGEGVAPS